MKDFFDQLWNSKDLINWSYVFTVVIFVYLWLKFVIKKPNRWWKIGSHIVIGSGFAVIYYYQKVPVTDLMLSFGITVIGYAWIIKSIIDKFPVLKVDDSKGIV